jgi:pilus assembly protein CpaF
MLSITISEKGGASKRRDFQKDEITIGRVQGNDIILPRGNVSKKHARIVQRDSKMVVLDLKSTNGTYVNGKRITAPQVVRDSDKIQVGDFVIQLAGAPAKKKEKSKKKGRKSTDRGVKKRLDVKEEPELLDDFEDFGGETSSTAVDVEEMEEETPKPKAKAKAKPKAEPSVEVEKPWEPEEPAPAKKKKKADPKLEKYSALQRDVHSRLIEYLDLRRLDIEQLGDEELWDQTERAVRNIIAQMETDGEIPGWVDVELLVKDVLNEALGLGPLEDFLADPTITEVMVNHSQQIYIERDGRLTVTDKTFSSDNAVLGVIERIVAPIGRRIDESVPMVDARLKDGSRVNAIIPPLALKGPCITIRKFKKEAMSVKDLIGFKTFNHGMSEFMEMCVKARMNCIVAGGTGSGKTTTLNCLSAFIPDSERIVTVEDAAELQLHQDHLVTLESRPPNIEGTGQITIRDLVRNCLRMRPDRIIVGECRGGEALDMLQAMNTGHDGSLTTVHANSPRDALARLETMVLMAGMDLPVRAIREQISSAVNIIIQQTRFSDGSRRVTAISEVTGMETDIITLQDIFYFKQEGFDEEGRVKGRFVSSGFIPKFYDDMQKRGIPVNMNIFQDS